MMMMMMMIVLLIITGNGGEFTTELTSQSHEVDSDDLDLY